MFSLLGQPRDHGVRPALRDRGAVAYPDRQVVAFVGDGGFTMLMAEFATAVKYNLTSRSSSSRTTRSARSSGSRWSSSATPSTAASCSRSTSPWSRAACGAQGFTIDDPTRCGEILREALATPGPVVIEAVVDPYEPPMPPKIEAKQALHFAEVAGARARRTRQDRAHGGVRHRPRDRLTARHGPPRRSDRSHRDPGLSRADGRSGGGRHVRLGQHDDRDRRYRRRGLPRARLQLYERRRRGARARGHRAAGRGRRRLRDLRSCGKR